LHKGLTAVVVIPEQYEGKADLLLAILKRNKNILYPIENLIFLISLKLDQFFPLNRLHPFRPLRLRDKFQDK
jgi:hypothetical protein